MSAAGHQVRVRLMKKRGAANQRDGNLHGVHEVVIFFARTRAPAHAEDSIFAMKVHGDAFWKIVGNEVGDAPAEVDVSAVGQFERGALRDLFAGKPRLTLHDSFLGSLTRHSKVPSPAQGDAQKS